MRINQSRVYYQYCGLANASLRFRTATINNCSYNTPIILCSSKENWRAINLGVLLIFCIEKRVLSLFFLDIEEKIALFYAIRIKVNLRLKINGGILYPREYISIVANKDLEQIIIPQTTITSSLSCIQIVFNNLNKIPTTKLNIIAANCTVAQYNSKSIKKPIKNVVLSDKALNISNITKVYKINCALLQRRAAKATVLNKELLTILLQTSQFYYLFYTKVLYLEYKEDYDFGVLLDNKQRLQG